MDCAVQGSKACLGWEREPAQGTYACTIVVDMWLQLLQHALHASHVLPAVPAPLDPRLSASFGILAGMESQVAASVAEHNAALQNLLGQMLTHWRVRHIEIRKDCQFTSKAVQNLMVWCLEPSWPSTTHRRVWHYNVRKV